MARPRKEGMEYFPHDTDAVNDTKIEALRMLYGNDGYAFYFIILELIYKQPNYELDISDAETIQILCKKVEVTQEKFNSMLQTAIKRECFDPIAYQERGVLTSEGIKKRSKVVVDKREKMRDKYRNGAVPLVSSPVSSIVSDAETGVESTQSKSKSKSKSKVKDKDISKISFAEFVKLTQEEYDKLVSTHGEDKTKQMIEILDNYKGANNKKYASDYRAILNWVVKRVEEEGARVGYRQTESFGRRQTITNQHNKHDSQTTNTNGQQVADFGNVSGIGKGVQENGVNAPPSKYDQFIRR